MTGSSAIYAGTVVHQRFRPRRHRLWYRVFSLLLDLDELPQLASRLRLFAYNNFGLFSFYDCDHGNGGDVRLWAESHMAAARLEPDGGAIRILCYPRVLGYVFNPLYFCHARSGTLEMFEAVGEEYWPLFFELLGERLAPGGMAVSKSLPSPTLPSRLIFFGPSYATTLAHWNARFQRHWHEIAEQGFDERFRRMWTYYLACSEASFRTGRTDVGQFVIARA